MKYELILRETAGAVGFFSTSPVEQMPLPEAARYLVEHPFDVFMRRFLLEGVGCLEANELGGIIGENLHAPKPFLALLYEATVMEPKFRALAGRFQGVEPEDLKDHSPLVAIRSELLDDHFVHMEWAGAVAANRARLEPLPDPDETDGLPVSDQDMAALAERQWVRLEGVETPEDAVESAPRPPAAETHATAMARLKEQGVLTEQEMRHEASLSPVALLHRWKLNRTVHNGRLDYELSGIQTSWGKGLDLDAARASYAMEMVERMSSFVSVDESGLKDYAREYPLIRSSASELAASGPVLDMATMRLDVPYEDQPLWWVEAQTAAGGTCYVPAQLVFLFVNLDEPGFLAGLSSTGLASGNTLEEAKLAALLECVERDAEAVAVHDLERCFRLESDDPQLSPLLASLREAGVDVIFQDLTPEYGVPAYYAYVQHQDGTVAKGVAASLDGKRAAVSALTEVPFPFPDSPLCIKGPDLPTRRWEDLPDYSAGNAGLDLTRLEALFAVNAMDVVYLDLTRADINLPVAKAMVPGLELTPDLDKFSRISPRLWERVRRKVGL